MLSACSSSSGSGSVTAAPDAPARGDGGVVSGDGSVSGDATPAPDAFVADPIEQDYDDSALMLAQVLRVPVDVAVLDGTTMAYGTPPAGFTSPMAGEWTGSHDAIAYTYTYHCSDALDNDNYTCGAGTNHVHWNVAANGTATLTGVTMSEDKFVGQWHIRDIDVQKPRVEGIGQFWLAGRVTGDGARLNLSSTSGTFTSVRYDAQPTAPINGTLAFTFNGHRSRASSDPADRDFTLSATFTFGATPTLSLDGTHAYSMDMTTGAVARM